MIVWGVAMLLWEPSLYVHVCTASFKVSINMSSGDDGCLCVEGEGRGRDSYTTASSFIQKFLQVVSTTEEV